MVLVIYAVWGNSNLLENVALMVNYVNGWNPKPVFSPLIAKTLIKSLNNNTYNIQIIELVAARNEKYF